MRTRHLAFVLILALLAASVVSAQPSGLLFHASFDKARASGARGALPRPPQPRRQQSPTADYAAGDPKSSLQSDLLGFHAAPGVKGTGMFLQPGERCTYQIAGNLDTSQGTFSCR